MNILLYVGGLALISAFIWAVILTILATFEVLTKKELNLNGRDIMSLLLLAFAITYFIIF